MVYIVVEIAFQQRCSSELLDDGVKAIPFNWCFDFGLLSSNTSFRMWLKHILGDQMVDFLG
jgi:hypothetical protein